MALIEINWSPSSRHLRTFGLTAFVVFTAMGALAWWRLHFLGMHLQPAQGMLAFEIAAAAGIVCGVLALLAPTLLRPLYVLLSAITMPIGMIVSFVVLMVFYFLILTPIAFLVRWREGDAMKRRWDKGAPSYWVRRSPPASRASYLRQY